MKLTLGFVVLVILLFIVHELVLGFWAWLDYRRIKHSRYKERTRRQFAEARNNLMHAAMSKDSEVNVNSLSFRFFYYINTAFMRNPDQYRQISNDLVSLFSNRHVSSSGEELLAESKAWSPAFKECVKLTADALGYLVLDYSWRIRWLYKMERKLNRELTPFQFMRKISGKINEEEDVEEPIVKIQLSQRVMYQMAEAI